MVFFQIQMGHGLRSSRQNATNPTACQQTPFFQHVRRRHLWRELPELLMLTAFADPRGWFFLAALRDVQTRRCVCAPATFLEMCQV